MISPSCLVLAFFLLPVLFPAILPGNRAVLIGKLRESYFLPSAYSLLQGRQTVPSKGARKSYETPAPVIDINQASAEDFAKLPGIGPELAGRIVAFREKHGPYRRVEDLLVIRGIGHKKWKALRPYLRVTRNAGKGRC